MSSSRVILPQGLITPQEVDGSGVLPMPESSFRALLGKPVPAFRVEDLKRVWSTLVEQDRDHPENISRCETLGEVLSTRHECNGRTLSFDTDYDSVAPRAARAAKCEHTARPEGV